MLRLISHLRDFGGFPRRSLDLYVRKLLFHVVRRALIADRCAIESGDSFHLGDILDHDSTAFDRNQPAIPQLPKRAVYVNDA